MDYCGIDRTGVFMRDDTCCQSTNRMECSPLYWPSGPAFEDVVEFAVNEEIWIRKYIEAWHLATENGVYTRPMHIEINEHRHDLEKKHMTVCRGLTSGECSKQEDCHYTIVGKAPEQRRHFVSACRNKHLLVNEQMYEGENFTNYRDLHTATLVNPKQSSYISTIYPASNALNR